MERGSNNLKCNEANLEEYEKLSNSQSQTQVPTANINIPTSYFTQTLEPEYQSNIQKSAGFANKLSLNQENETVQPQTNKKQNKQENQIDCQRQIAQDEDTQ